MLDKYKSAHSTLPALPEITDLIQVTLINLSTPVFVFAKGAQLTSSVGCCTRESGFISNSYTYLQAGKPFSESILFPF